MKYRPLFTAASALGLALSVLFIYPQGTEAKAAPRTSLDKYERGWRSGAGSAAVSRATYIKRGSHVKRQKVAKKGKAKKAKAKWVRVKVKKARKAPTEWALIRKDRYKHAVTLAAAAKRHGVPVRLAIAVGIQESGLNPRASGDHGQSYGLMQIKCRTARLIGYSGKCSGLYNPNVNAEWGMRYLKMALDGGGVWKYNQGIHARRPVRMAARYQAKVHRQAAALVLARFGL